MFQVKQSNIVSKFIIGIALIFTIISGYSCKANRMLTKANKRYEIGEYTKAATMYRRAYTKIKDPSQRAEIIFYQGECYRLLGENSKAESSYKQAIRGKHSDTTLLSNIAFVQMKLKKIKDAKLNFQAQLKLYPNDIVAQNGLLSCDSLLTWQKINTHYQIKRFDILNSKNSDFAPSLTGDDYDMLYFTSTREGKLGKQLSQITGQNTSDIYSSKKDAKGIWQKPEIVDEPTINTQYDEGITSFSANGKTMVFTRCSYVDTKPVSAEIFKSDRSGAKWGVPQKLMLTKDTTANIVVYAHAAFNSDGSTIYFVSDMAGGFGGKDIWKMTKIGDDFGIPENLGSKINSARDEMFPTIRNDSMLYFSSNGLPGFGGLDIFRAIITKDSVVTISNMGSPINSEADDFGITFAGEKEEGFFSSNRLNNKGYDKIYSFIRPETTFSMKGKINDEKSGDPIPDAIIRLIGNDGTNEKIYTKKDGSFSHKLKKQTEYVFLVIGKGYLNNKGSISTVGLDNSKVFEKNIALQSIKKPIRLENIVYDFGKWELTDTAKSSLLSLVEILKDNGNITIELSAHTDMVGTDQGNLELSNKRAQSVVDFLIQKNIAADRMVAKGYGKSKPIIVDSEMAKQHTFLTVGDELTPEYIQKLTLPQQEIANQINRRTEFKVLSTNYKPIVRIVN